MYDFYISTGTTENEIRVIAKRRNIALFFKGIFGSPLSKGHQTKKIMKSNDYKATEIVFIGDAPSDKDAAKENKIHFIARVKNKESPLINEKIKIKDLSSLAELIE